MSYTAAAHSNSNVKKRVYRRYAYVGLSALVISCLTSCDSTPTYDYIEGETMGTSYHIRFRQPHKNATSNKATIQKTITDRLQAINNSMSTYQDDSLISTFNRMPANKPLIIDSDFAAVLQESKRVYQQSGGAFDPTVMPLVNLWGFGKVQTVERLQNPPSNRDIQQAQALIDFDSVTLDANGQNTDTNAQAVIKKKDGVEIDFSAIAKGYGVDAIADVLHDEYQINHYMVEIGGEVATRGVNPISQPWQIAIDAPIDDSRVTNRKPLTFIRQPASTMQMHLATSGNYRNSVVFDNKRYSHTIDPISGQPVAGGAPSVSVIADSVTLADAWATALTAMPYQQALKTAQENALAALFIIPIDGDLTDIVPSSANDNPDLLNAQWQVVETPAMQMLRRDRQVSTQ